MNNIPRLLFVVFSLIVIGLTVSSAQSKKFTLQVESLDSQAPALALIKQLKSSGVDAYYLKSNIPGKGIFYRIRVGSFADASTAQELGEKLRRAQLIKDYFVARYEGSTSDVLSTAALSNTSSTLLVNESKPVVVEIKQPALVPGDTTVSNTVTPSSSVPAPSKGGLQFGDESGWEIYLAGGGSFWSHQDAELSINDVLKVTPDPGLPNDKLQIRQSFAPGGKLVLGLVKNINNWAALEFSYTYGTNNFKLTALENGSNVQVSEIKKGMTRSLGMRSHIAGINYRHSFVNNEHARFYLTGGFNLTVFQPNDDGLDRLFGQIPSFDPDDFKQKPHFKTVAAPGVNFGAGVIVKVHENVGLRFDVRDYLTFTKRVKGSAELKTGEKLEMSLFGNTLHNLVPTFGVVFTP